MTVSEQTTSQSATRPVYRQELTPLSFLERSAAVHATRTAVIDGEARFTYSEWLVRARRFADALAALGVGKGDRVAFLAFNSEPLQLAHFAVPMVGAIVVAINTRLSPDEIGYILGHSGSKLVFYSPELAEQLAQAPQGVQRISLGSEFEEIVAGGSEEPSEAVLEDEYEVIAIDYTSGTTGRPKGVMYHHRGAYLNAVAMAMDLRLDCDSRYLWTLPMFHCNGWCFTWATVAAGATSVCMPKVDPALVWRLLKSGQATAFCGAPTVLIMLVNDHAAERLEQPVRVLTAGAPPSPTIISEMRQLNFDLQHVYGLTETYGPYTINVPPPGSEQLPPVEQATRRARQGHPNLLAGEVRVVDPELNDVSRDGETLGEVVMRGNVVMKGYFANEEATEAAFAGGWFHSGDIGVMHPDGGIELRDRKKDIIISGGENISTIEVEQAVVSHPAVMEVAVIAIPDEKWGEVPKAFVTLKPDSAATAEEIVAHCRGRLAGFKVPKAVEFGELPKTSTGKIQKFLLREREWGPGQRRIN